MKNLGILHNTILGLIEERNDAERNSVHGFLEELLAFVGCANLLEPLDVSGLVLTRRAGGGYDVSLTSSKTLPNK